MICIISGSGPISLGAYELHCRYEQTELGSAVLEGVEEVSKETLFRNYGHPPMHRFKVCRGYFVNVRGFM